MSSAPEIYQRHLRKQLAIKGYAVWPPGRVLHLGDVVTLGRGGDLRKQTDLHQLNIELHVESGRAQPISATSERIQEAAGRASGGALAVAKADIDLLFQDKGMVVFEVQDFQHLQIANLAEIQRRVVELHRRGSWQAPWCLVDQLWWVGTGTIIVSETDKAEIVISAEVLAGTPLLTALADPRARAKVDVKGGAVAKVVGGADFPAMFTGMRLDFWKTDLKPISTRGSNGDEGEPRWVRVSLDDVEEAWRSTD